MQCRRLRLPIFEPRHQARLWCPKQPRHPLLRHASRFQPKLRSPRHARRRDLSKASPALSAPISTLPERNAATMSPRARRSAARANALASSADVVAIGRLKLRASPFGAAAMQGGDGCTCAPRPNAPRAKSTATSPASDTTRRTIASAASTRPQPTHVRSERRALGRSLFGDSVETAVTMRASPLPNPLRANRVDWRWTGISAHRTFRRPS